MPEDIVKTLGFLTLGSRFRRLGERLQADTQQVIEAHGLVIQSAHYPFLAAVDRAGPLTIGDLAQAVGISQPGATRTISQLQDLGYLELNAAPEDQRRKLASLTKKGQALVDRSKETVWPQIEKAVIDICGDLSGTLLEQIAAIENALAAAPLGRRPLADDQSSTIGEIVTDKKDPQ
jgi:DNA-binding MarR family transcriptional regulator